MQPDKTLYVSDLDGTLLDSSIRIPGEAADMINRAIDCGALFTVATARTPGTLGSLLREIHLNLPAIVMTGATMWHRDSGAYSNTQFFPESVISELREIYSSHGLSYFLYTLRDNKIYVYHHGPLSDMEREFIAARSHSPYKTFIIPPNGNSLFPEKIDNAMLLFAMQPAGMAHPAYRRLCEVEGVTPMCYNDANDPEIAMIEVFPEHASKAQAIRTLARDCGAGRIVVFGDNLNDLSMFAIADTAVAVSNAVPEVLEKADVVIGHHDSSAVARYILSDYLDSADAAKSRILEL